MDVQLCEKTDDLTLSDTQRAASHWTLFLIKNARTPHHPAGHDYRLRFALWRRQDLVDGRILYQNDPNIPVGQMLYSFTFQEKNTWTLQDIKHNAYSHPQWLRFLDTNSTLDASSLISFIKSLHPTEVSGCDISMTFPYSPSAHQRMEAHRL